MTFLLDTNILLHYIRESPLFHEIQGTYAPLKKGNRSIISVVNVAEIRSIAVQAKWGIVKTRKLEEILRELIIIEIRNNILIDRYVQIDAFSQNKLPQQPLGLTPRNMGKNDLWIAATASVLGAKLLTTDSDFNHLQGVFLDIKQFSR